MNGNKLFVLYEPLKTGIECIYEVNPMKYMTCVTEDKIQGIIDEEEVLIVEELLNRYPSWSSNPFAMTPISANHRKCIQQYIKNTENGSKVDWSKIHGKHRKLAKFQCKKASRRIRYNMKFFNEFAGREDVIYIFARMDKKWMDTHRDELSEDTNILAITEQKDSKGLRCGIYLKISKEIDHE